MITMEPIPGRKADSLPAIFLPKRRCETNGCVPNRITYTYGSRKILVKSIESDIMKISIKSYAQQDKSL